MNQTNFSEILQNPEIIGEAHTEGLEEIIESFPYFQPARALYLKALKNKESFKYNQELKTTAAYTTDRGILFDFITSSHFKQNEVSQFIKHNTAHLKDIQVTTAQDISVNKSVVIDDALKQHIKDTKGILDKELFQPKIRPSELVSFQFDKSEPIKEVDHKIKDIEVEQAEADLNLGKPLDFSKHESYSFSEWLSLANIKPINRENNDLKTDSELNKPTKIVSEKERKFQLIDNFINKNPKIKPTDKPKVNYNIAKAQMIKQESLMTETLARVFLEQKNYKKAIQAYNILSLKYPEKSGFFADQIKAVKQIQEQNSKE